MQSSLDDVKSFLKLRDDPRNDIRKKMSWVDNLLKPVVSEYCKGEVLRDSAEFLYELNEIETDGQTEDMNLIGRWM